MLQHGIVPLRQHAAKGGGAGGHLLLLTRHVHLYTAGADGGQQHMGRGGTEDKSGVGRPFLHDLQQHVLILWGQLLAVGEDAHLPLTLVGADVHIAAHLPNILHRQVAALRILHPHHIGVDVLHHLAALGTLQAGAFSLAAAQVGCGGKAGGSSRIPAACQNNGMAQGAALGSGTDGGGPCAVVVGTLFHTAPPFFAHRRTTPS